MGGFAGSRCIICTIFCATILLFGACSAVKPVAQQPESIYPYKHLKKVRYAIQVGAFQNLDNAVRLTEKLQRQGLNAYHYIDPSGLYKVRFGNYSTSETARREASFLQARGIINEYFIISPQLAAIEGDLRGGLVQAARSFIGIPYKWGGDSRREGFDCSGLTMTVYQLNGLDLPRTSRQQWYAGTPVGRRELASGDLVFFATSGGKRVSHVGIYVGENRFIHAPGRGKTIRVASLSSKYYRKRYLGGRRYL